MQPLLWVMKLVAVDRGLRLPRQKEVRVARLHDQEENWIEVLWMYV
jgi:hypothetical protein